MKQETQFSLFRALSTKQPPTLITLEEVYRLITTDNSLRGNTEKFRYFKSHGFEKEADEIKRTRCPAFTPAARKAMCAPVTVPAPTNTVR